jgi:adenosylmethionine-8-amino-7-oxononanoate aminotransferase
MLDLVDKLKEITPKGLDRFFFWNSGAEAVEGELNEVQLHSFLFFELQLRSN